MPTPTIYTVTVYSKSGEKSVRTSLMLDEAVKILETLSSDFARSLANTYTSGRTMSYKQQDWAIYLAQEHLDKAALASAPAPATRTLGDLSGVYGLFDTASAHLKRAKIRIQTAKGQRVVLSVASRGRHPGSILVTDGRPYGENTFYGYVHPTGETTVRNDDVLDILERLATDPAGTAAEYGRGSGECCFCGRDLSNTEVGSADVGYGPICAKHWGLPWSPNGRTFVALEGKPILSVVA